MDASAAGPSTGAEDIDALLDEQLQSPESQINTSEIETAIAKAKQLEAGLDKLDKGGNLVEIYETIGDLTAAIYKSGAWQIAESTWRDKVPGPIKTALLGEGIGGFAIKGIPATRPVVTAFQGLAQTGMLEAPAGIDPADFTTDALSSLKMAKWLIVIAAFVQPEVAALEPLLPILERLIVEYDHMTSVVRNRIESINNVTRQEIDSTGIIDLADNTSSPEGSPTEPDDPTVFRVPPQQANAA